LSGEPLLYAFVIPVAVVIVANLVVFVVVLVNLCRRRNKGMISNQSERKMALLHFQAALSILVVMGTAKLLKNVIWLKWIFNSFN